MGEIYCLYSTSERLPRYVGIAIGATETSFKKDVTDALDRLSDVPFEWMRKVWGQGHEIAAHTLQIEVADDDLEFYFGYWMAQFTGLLNEEAKDVSPPKPTEIGRQIIKIIKKEAVES